MSHRSTQVLSRHSWLRVPLAVALLMVGLAPIGVPILSDNTWRQTASDRLSAGNAEQPPFAYRWSNSSAGATVERSDDASRTWHIVAGLPEPVVQIEATPGNEQVAFALSTGAIWISADGGATWTQTAPPPSRPLSIAVSGSNTGTVFIGTESFGLAYSRDRGATWHVADQTTPVGSGPAATAVTALAVDPKDDAIIYAATAVWLGTSRSHLTPAGAYVSVDGGGNWLKMADLELDAGPVTLITPVAGKLLTAILEDHRGTHTLALTGGRVADELESSDAGVRATAARALGIIGDPATAPALLARLSDPDALAGDRAAEALGRLQQPSVAPALLKALDSSEATVRARAALALGLMRVEQATPRLAQILHGSDPNETGRAAGALAAIGTPAALDALTSALADSGMTPARHAAMGALELAAGRAEPALIAALEAESPALRANAAQMLGWLRSEPATEALATALADAEHAVRAEAAWALGELATAQARETLVAAAAAEANAGVRNAISAAITRADAGLPKDIAGARWGEALLAQLALVPASRWTFLALSVGLAAALLWLSSRRAAYETC